jgi:flavin-binding protein dodecin
MSPHAIAKVVEILAEGETIEKAAEAAVAEASKTIKNIRGLYIKEMQAKIENQKITGFRINAKITFVVEH